MLVSGRNWRFIGTNGLLLSGKISPGHQGIVRRLPGLTTRVRIGIAMNTRETPPFDILDLKVGTFRIRDFPCIIVVMPPPANICEAHFVGIILKSESNPETPPEEIDFAYMVLEKGLDPESKTERTVLCSWLGDVHENHGDGPNATPEDFVCALEDRL